MTNIQFNLPSINYYPHKDVIFQETDGESVLMHMGDNQYFTLDAIGTRIWQLLSDQNNLQTVYQQIMDEYDVDQNTLKQDIEKLIDQLTAAHLLSDQAT